MKINQFAVYQLKNIPENRQVRFRSYRELQEKGIQICSKDYDQVYLGLMRPEEKPESIREKFDRQLPRTFKGHSVSVGDVLVLNREGIVTSYYVEKNNFTVITGFIRKSSSDAVVSIDTTRFHIEGKEGSWQAFDSIILDGKDFFLMENEAHEKKEAWVVVDEYGKLIVDRVCHGFDQTVVQQIWDYRNPSEQNCKMNEGRQNHLSQESRESKKGKASVLVKLHQKQAEIAKRNKKAIQ